MVKLPFLTSKKKLEKVEASEAQLKLQLALQSEREDKDREERRKEEESLHREVQQKEQELASIRQDKHFERIKWEAEVAELRKRDQIEEEKIRRERAAQLVKAKKLKEASPETIRNLRMLIRDRHKLDVEIWSLRGSRKPDRYIVTSKMEKADAIMQEILSIISIWDHETEGIWTEEEWKKVEAIRDRLQGPGKRVWRNDPPWDH